MHDVFASIWDTFVDFLSSPTGLLVVWATGICMGAFLLSRFSRWWGSLRGRRFRHRGKKAEKKAARILSKAGYEIVEREPHIQNQLLINGQIRRFDITPDFWVKRDGETLFVEVKSHGECQLVNQAGIRRQLVEYLYASGQPCLLVTTMDSQITRIEFPTPAK